NEPGYASRSSSATRERVDEVYSRLRPFPLPNYMRLARDELVALKAFPGTRKLQQFLVILDGFLLDSRPSEPTSIAHSYLRVLVLMSKGLHHRRTADWFGGPRAWKQHLHDAEAECERALEYADCLLTSDLTKEDREMIEQLRPFLLINQVQLVI